MSESVLELTDKINEKVARDLSWRQRATTLLGLVGADNIDHDKLVEMCQKCIEDERDL